MEPAADIHLTVTTSGQAHQITVPSSSTLIDLCTLLASTFHISTTAQKLILKGKRLDQLSPERQAEALDKVGVHEGSKLLLMGLDHVKATALAEAEALRVRKSVAYQHHSLHPASARVRNTTVHGISDDDGEQFRFHQLVPFPESVPCFAERQRMLKKLSEDKGVRDIMKRRRYTVGILTELHPTLQPTLLGLNKNAGQEISLRLLTDDLSGTRNYASVRKVLLHELVHNIFGPHDVKFNTLNSLLNKELGEYELREGIISAPGARVDERPWEPEGEDMVKRTSYRLDEVVDSPRAALSYTEEDMAEERRERARLAAERRLREE